MAADVPKSTDSTLSLGRALVVFAQLADLPPAERARRITELSVKDQGLHAQVLSLLQQQGQPAQAVRRRRRSGRIGPYRIVEFVGAGGMGEVYRAEQDEPRRAVALKLLRPGPTTAAVLRWFHREASVLARLRHPGIVQIHATGWVDGPSGSEPYLAMEFVDGEPLLQVTERLPIEQRVKLLADLCCAIDHAHRRGVIHRDLKPENVLVETGSDGPRPRVLDFGVALPITDAAATHTRSDRELAGTLGYMSPEQIDGNADVRSDVYSLGAVAYQVLSGRMPLPLRGTRLSVALERIRTLEPLRLGTIDPRLRGDLDCIVGRALAKLPDQRYQSAAALAADLRRHLARLPVLARRHTALYLFGRLLQRRLASTALVALLLLSTALGIFGTLHGLLRATDASERLAGVLARVVTHVRENLDQTAGTADSRQEMLQDCRQQLTSLAGSNPENFEIQHAFADVEELQGNLLRARGQSRAAFELRLQNHQHRRWLELRRPAPRQEHELANAGVLVGDLLKEQGDLRQAQHWYDDAHVLFAQLAAAAGDDRRAQDDLACSYH
ncbi:MAG TPA: serine/threonine-protein kinase, partial [Planctomycetota bacterium]|nr:serine/threonine-protein kinase [Planctomycetota bacterium]